MIQGKEKRPWPHNFDLRWLDHDRDSGDLIFLALDHIKLVVIHFYGLDHDHFDFDDMIFLIQIQLSMIFAPTPKREWKNSFKVVLFFIQRSSNNKSSFQRFWRKFCAPASFIHCWMSPIYSFLTIVTSSGSAGLDARRSKWWAP